MTIPLKAIWTDEEEVEASRERYLTATDLTEMLKKHPAGHPFVKTPHIDRIGREGALFRNAFLTTPLCSPSRASFVTGQYAYTHGITDNVDRSIASHNLITFPLLLQQAGYATAFIGKWHMGNDDSPRRGFDRWVSFKGQGSYILFDSPLREM